MTQGLVRERNADVPAALAAIVAFCVYVWLLTQATAPVVAALSALSGNKPMPYAALLALLVALPGLLLTLPRALSARRAIVLPQARTRRQHSAQRVSHLRTDVLGVAALILAQVPLPAPWGPSGKAATIANITRSAEIVEVSIGFATASLWVLAAGLVAAVLAKVYGHAPALRVLAIALAVGAPVLAWFVVTRSALS